MRKRTLFQKMSLLLAAGMLLGGCGQTSGTESVQPDSTEAGIGNISEQITGGKVTLNVWGAEEDEALLTQMIESFKANYAGPVNALLIYLGNRVK